MVHVVIVVMKLMMMQVYLQMDYIVFMEFEASNNVNGEYGNEDRAHI